MKVGKLAIRGRAADETEVESCAWQGAGDAASGEGAGRLSLRPGFGVKQRISVARVTPASIRLELADFTGTKSVALRAPTQ